MVKMVTILHYVYFAIKKNTIIGADETSCFKKKMLRSFRKEKYNVWPRPAKCSLTRQHMGIAADELTTRHPDP